jgi:hypothetical protein
LRKYEELTVKVGWGGDCEAEVDFAEMNFGSVRYEKIE